MKNISFHIWYFIAILIASCSLDEKPDTSGNNPVATKHQVEHLIVKDVKQIANNQVCMVNDKFMTSDQIAVSINGEIYYGCYAGCVPNLKSDNTYRLTTDLVTGERVDKANAVIILMPDSKDQVIYFKSETNARTYIESHVKN